MRTCSVACLFTLWGGILLSNQPASAALEPTKDTLEIVKKNLADKKAVLVDSRSPEEWDEGHLKDAVLMPLVRLEKNSSADDLAKVLSKQKIVYIYCRSGRRALLAGEILKKLGYEVRPLKPGYKDLLDGGFEKAK